MLQPPLLCLSTIYITHTANQTCFSYRPPEEHPLLVYSTFAYICNVTHGLEWTVRWTSIETHAHPLPVWTGRRNRALESPTWSIIPALGTERGQLPPAHAWISHRLGVAVPSRLTRCATGFITLPSGHYHRNALTVTQISTNLFFPPYFLFFVFKSTFVSRYIYIYVCVTSVKIIMQQQCNLMTERIGEISIATLATRVGWCVIFLCIGYHGMKTLYE